MREQPEILVDDADAPAQQGGFPARDAGGMDAQNIDPAKMRMLGQIHQFQHAGLAGARGAGQPAEAAIRDIEGHGRDHIHRGGGAFPLMPVFQPDIVESDHSVVP
jgi:hypothetical protein